MFDPSLNMTRPGLFVTGTDTGVGKTAITCAIAWQLRQQSALRVGVCKPFASGCRREREGLVSDDAEALAHFADCRLPLDVISPIRFRQPLSPAAAAEQAGQAIDYEAIARSLARLEADSDVMLIEGVGGLLAPIDPADPQRTVLDLITAINYPVLVVARAGLGTLNHTAMTVRLLRQARCRIVGLVINGYEADAASIDAPDARTAEGIDLSMSSNRIWLQKMTRLPILAVVPRVSDIAPEKGVIPETVMEAVGHVAWEELIVATTGR